MVKTIAMVVHPHRREVALAAERAERFFRDRGLSVFYPQRGENPPEGEIMVLTFGGDGTLLIGAGYARQYRAPLLGINHGTVGFLTEGEPDRLDEILPAIMSGEYEEEPRSLLKIRVGDREFHALNDVVITRGGYARLISVDAFVNEERLGTFVADGIIAATPTGSTAYSLSAGGPLVSPGVKCILITPVCAHSFQRSSYVVHDHQEIRFVLRAEKPQSAELQVDGQNKMRLSQNDEVIVTGAEESLRLIRLKPFRFFTTARLKLSEWNSREERSCPK